MRVRTAVLVAAFAGGGLLAVQPGTVEAQARPRSQPASRPQGPSHVQAQPAKGRPGGQSARPVHGQPGRPVYGRPVPARPHVRVGFGYGYYRPAYLYSPWGWYPWYPYEFYGWYSYPYGPYGYYGYSGYNGSSLKIEVQPKDQPKEGP